MKRCVILTEGFLNGIKQYDLIELFKIWLNVYLECIELSYIINYILSKNSNIFQDSQFGGDSVPQVVVDPPAQGLPANFNQLPPGRSDPAPESTPDNTKQSPTAGLWAVQETCMIVWCCFKSSHFVYHVYTSF